MKYRTEIRQIKNEKIITNLQFKLDLLFLYIKFYKNYSKNIDQIKILKKAYNDYKIYCKNENIILDYVNLFYGRLEVDEGTINAEDILDELSYLYEETYKYLDKIINTLEEEQEINDIKKLNIETLNKGKMKELIHRI